MMSPNYELKFAEGDRTPNYPYGNIVFIFFAAVFPKVLFLERALFRFLDFPVKRCPLKAFALLTFPFLVILNLLAIAFFVFNFGIITPNPKTNTPSEWRC